MAVEAASAPHQRWRSTRRPNSFRRRPRHAGNPSRRQGLLLKGPEAGCHWFAAVVSTFPSCAPTASNVGVRIFTTSVAVAGATTWTRHVQAKSTPNLSRMKMNAGGQLTSMTTWTCGCPPGCALTMTTCRLPERAGPTGRPSAGPLRSNRSGHGSKPNRKP